MASTRNPLTNYVASLVGQAVGKAINWYVGRGYDYKSIVNSLISRGFLNTRVTVNSLIEFFTGRKIDAIKLGKKSSKSVISATDYLSISGNPQNIKVKYNIIVDDINSERDIFGNLDADCPNGLTKAELMECIYQHADNFLNYYDYEISAYHVDVVEMSSF